MGPLVARASKTVGPAARPSTFLLLLRNMYKKKLAFLYIIMYYHTNAIKKHLERVDSQHFLFRNCCESTLSPCGSAHGGVSGRYLFLGRGIPEGPQEHPKGQRGIPEGPKGHPKGQRGILAGP